MKNLYQQTTFIMGTPDSRGVPADDGIEVAFAGRSNAGKSSALNVLTEQKSLARISKALERVDARAGAVDLWMKENLEMTAGRSRASSRDWDAYHEGKRAGNTIDLSGPSGGKAGRKALKPGN